MKNTLSRLLREVIKDENITNIPITGISTNSVKVNPGELYIAIKGNKVDGHGFIPEAIKNGAAAIITDNRFIDELPIPKEIEIKKDINENEFKTLITQDNKEIKSNEKDINKKFEELLLDKIKKN